MADDKRAGMLVGFDMFEALLQLSDEELGKLMRAGMGFLMGEEEAPEGLGFAWVMFRNRIDFCRKAFEEGAARRSARALAGAEARWGKDGDAGGRKARRY